MLYSPLNPYHAVFYRLHACELTKSSFLFLSSSFLFLAAISSTCAS